MTDGENGKHLSTVPDVEDAFYRLLVDSVRDYAIFFLDPLGHVISWNIGAEASNGYAAHEIVGKHFRCFYPPEKIKEKGPEHELAIALTEGRFKGEGWRVRKDGSTFWASIVITPLRGEDGKLLGFGQVARDLTEKRQHEEELRQSEERFRTLVKGVTDYAIFMLDPEGFVKTWNDGAQHLKGYSAEEIIGAHFSIFYPPAAIKSNWPAHELRSARMEGHFEDEGWRLRKDGSRFWANVVLTAIRDSTGKLMGFAKVTRDLTDRWRREEQLRQSEERFRLLIEGVKDYAIVMLDQNGHISSWNAGASRIHGYRVDEILGKHLSRFYTSEDVARHLPWSDLSEAQRSGRISREGWKTRKDGTLFWAHSIISALFDGKGRPYGFASITQDLTERRHAETLADTAQRMHEFIAMLAHELRNPLAPIRNAVTLMEKKGLHDPVLDSMRETIDRQSKVLARLIDDLLDVNRIARGKLSVDKKVIDLVEVVQHALHASRPFIDSFGHRTHEDLPKQPVHIQGDFVRLNQAVTNLLNNAAKYTPAGGDIWISIKATDMDAEMSVRDSGNGIPAEHLTTIFDLFTQLHPDDNLAGGGLGVGLALVRRVVELHAGTVRAKSDGPGRGSEFVVKLPLSIRTPTAVQGQAVKPNTTDVAFKLRVLIVDDNRDAADSLHHLLKTMGQTVYTVYTGAAALVAAEAFAPDVVVLDIGMPDMNGYEVAEKLQAAPGRDRPVLIAVTGWAQPADKARSRKAGFTYHFPKPVSDVALEEALIEIARSRRE